MNLTDLIKRWINPRDRFADNRGLYLQCTPAGAPAGIRVAVQSAELSNSQLHAATPASAVSATLSIGLRATSRLSAAASAAVSVSLTAAAGASLSSSPGIAEHTLVRATEIVLSAAASAAPRATVQRDNDTGAP